MLKPILYFFIQAFIIGTYCEVEVWLTVASRLIYKNDKWNERLIELNWRNAQDDHSIWIGLFSKEIEETVKYSEALIVIQPETRNGLHRTDIEFPVHVFDESDVTPKCLGFYIVYARARKVIAKNCIKTNPKWMEENYKQIRRKSVSSLMIPGTHNSAAYYQGYQDSGFFRSFVDNYAICQDENIFNQLVYGIRYLDLRVMWSPTKQGEVTHELWMAHDTVQLNNTFMTVLKDIKKFMDFTSKEVVIVDFHRFPYGFDTQKEDKHKMLLELLKNVLGEYLSTYEYYDVTIGNLVKSGKRLIIGYAENDIDRPDFLYPAVYHRWANTDDMDRLYDYLSDKMCNGEKYSPFAEAAMAELTPETTGVIFNTYGGLRALADNVNHFITKWFHDEFLTCANIVATDFFLGNNIIEVAINKVKKRN